MNPSTPEPRQLDAIREIVNIGAGHAATNVSTLTGLTVMISVPRLFWGGESEALLARRGGRLVMVEVPILGSGASPDERACLVLSHETALHMAGLMLRRAPSSEIDALQRSTLAELGNIVCAAYVGVLSSFTGESVLIGPPALTEGDGPTLRARLGEGLVIETDFRFPDATFEGLFLLSHTHASFAGVLAALGLGPRR